MVALASENMWDVCTDELYRSSPIIREALHSFGWTKDIERGRDIEARYHAKIVNERKAKVQQWLESAHARQREIRNSKLLQIRAKERDQVSRQRNKRDRFVTTQVLIMKIALYLAWRKGIIWPFNRSSFSKRARLWYHRKWMRNPRTHRPSPRGKYFITFCRNGIREEAVMAEWDGDVFRPQEKTTTPMLYSLLSGVSSWSNYMK